MPDKKIKILVLGLLKVFLGMATIVSAQQNTDQSHIHELLKESKCKTYKSIYQYDSLISKETVFLVSIDSITQSRFSGRSIRMAASIGILELLKEYSNLESLLDKDSITTNLSLLFLRQELDERLTLNFMDVTTMLVEIDCEQERLTEIRNYVQDNSNRKARALNILAITSGSLETLGGGLIAFFSPEARGLALGLSITGGLTSGYWGARQLFVKKEVELCHSRNHLREIMEHPAESKIFPPNVWFFLTVPSGMESDTISKRTELMEEYTRSGFMDGYKRQNGKEVKVSEILFSDSGTYDVPLLSVRINMLELLKMKINLMKYDMKRLQQELILKGNIH